MHDCIFHSLNWLLMSNCLEEKEDLPLESTDLSPAAMSAIRRLFLFIDLCIIFMSADVQLYHLLPDLPTNIVRLFSHFVFAQIVFKLSSE